MKLFIGTGVEGHRPVGYTTVDIAPENSPDIVADASDLHVIPDGAAEELYASHVLEHFPFPGTVRVLAEWARVLRLGGIIKIAVPDMEALGSMLVRGENPFHVMHMVYGAHWATPGGPQGHHFGFTRHMLVELLTVLGFGSSDWWNSDLPEAANGWFYGENGERLGVSVNIAGTKISAPLLDPGILAQRLRERIPESFMVVVRDLMTDPIETLTKERIDAMLFQRLHFRLIEERRRSLYLESQLEQYRDRSRKSDR